MSTFKNEPPKDIAAAIWGSCFDYKDIDTVVNDQTIRDRVNECWARIHGMLYQNTDWFVSFVNSHIPDELNPKE